MEKDNKNSPMEMYMKATINKEFHMEKAHTNGTMELIIMETSIQELDRGKESYKNKKFLC